MPTPSPARASVPTLPLPLVNRGKVRDTYELPDDKLLVVTTDAISIFDFVLNALVPGKGCILNALSHLWNSKLAELGFATHHIASGAAIDEHLPEPLRGNRELQTRASVVRRLKMLPVEFIARGYLTGSGLQSYLKDRTVCGHRLPDDLQDGDLLPYPLDTPTTKAEEGHDVALDARDIRRKFGEVTLDLLAVYGFGRWYAEQRGIVLADTKLEFGLSPNGTLTVGDEILTADSSRYWDLRAWRAGRSAVTRKAPPPLDKQLVRAWGIREGINKRSPEGAGDTAVVHDLRVPQSLIAATVQTYRYIFWRLTGNSIEDYLEGVLKVPQQRARRRVIVVLGSESDLPTVRDTLRSHRERFDTMATHVISCHRNPAELGQFASESFWDIEAVVAVGGKAFALPGILKSLLTSRGIDTPVVGVALGQPGTEAFEAARLSIKELPGQPVVMDEQTGEPYAGANGLDAALWRIAEGELPPPTVSEPRPAKHDIALD
jgi:phosphoribosylaminoimidazole-succinocarboxamide synthase